MPILVDCPCGKKLQAKEELLGKRVRCPACSGVVTVERVLDAIPEPEPPALDEKAVFELARPTSRPPAKDAPRPILEDDETLYDQAHRRKRRPKTPAKNWWSTGPGQVVGGILMVVGGATVFVLALLADRIWPYPGILVVLGFIAIIKGLMECAKAPAPIDDDDGYAPDDDEEDDSRHQ